MEFNEEALTKISNSFDYREIRPQWIVKVNGRQVKVNRGGTKSFISERVAMNSILQHYWGYHAYDINDRATFKLYIDELIKRGVIEIVKIEL